MATTYQIINYETGQALAVDGDADSVTMQQRAAGDDAQLWTCPANPEEGDFDIVNKKTGGHLSAIRANGRLLCGDDHYGWDLPDFPEISPSPPAMTNSSSASTRTIGHSWCPTGKATVRGGYSGRCEPVACHRHRTFARSPGD
ncbi:RICIN domain-containing protein [Nocardia sp. NPDC019219]|uniref:RICIN domain-containing protein n=1 Tax=Nocardia sp. NPDC019219 TaxID=3154590 RepID=UPI0033FDA285